jgi:hypothetical protein
MLSLFRTMEQTIMHFSDLFGIRVRLMKKNVQRSRFEEVLILCICKQRRNSRLDTYGSMLSLLRTRNKSLAVLPNLLRNEGAQHRAVRWSFWIFSTVEEGRCPGIQSSRKSLYPVSRYLHMRCSNPCLKCFMKQLELVQDTFL